jgi:hypothetical protein
VTEFGRFHLECIAYAAAELRQWVAEEAGTEDDDDLCGNAQTFQIPLQIARALEGHVAGLTEMFRQGPA